MSARNSRAAKDARNVAAAADLARREAIRSNVADALGEKMRNAIREIANTHNTRLAGADLFELRKAHAGRVAEGESLPAISKKTTREELIEMLTITLADEDIILEGEQ